MKAWTRDDASRSLLEVGPFETESFRDACVQTHPRWRDASLGARLDDGSRAALALLKRGSTVESVPYGYGGVRSTRELTTGETLALYEFARVASGAEIFVVRGVGESPAQRIVSRTHVVELGIAPLAAAWSPRARQSIRRCERAGGQLQLGSGATDFLRLYGKASAEWQMQYPPALISALWEAGVLQIFEVVLAGEVISAAVALTGADEWMYWFGAQNDVGRRCEAGYLALSGLLTDAQEAGAGQVNLGGSVARGESLRGVQSFKERFGGIATPVTLYEHRTVRGRLSGGARGVLRSMRARARGNR